MTSQADPCTRQKVQLVRNGDVVASVRRVFVGVRGLVEALTCDVSSQLREEQPAQSRGARSRAPE